MKVFKIVLTVILWIAVICGCVYVKKLSNEAAEVQQNYVEVEGVITKIASSHANISEDTKEVNGRTRPVYHLKLYQSIVVSYETEGEEYSYMFSNLTPYSLTSEDSFSTAERIEIEDTKGYKVDEVFMLYVDENNPSEPLDKVAVDHRASGSSVTMKFMILIFLGVVLSFVINFTSPRKRNRY